MKLIQKVLSRSTGLHFRQEYLCLHHEHFDQPLNVYLTNKHRVLKDITHHHAFVGYYPLIFALSIQVTEANTELEIIFSHKKLNPGENAGKKVVLACLFLKK